VMSLRGTASGRLFAAHLPRAEVRAVLRMEAALEGTRSVGMLDAGFAAELDAIRAAGLARAVDLLLPGVSALAAPVFDGAGRMVLALTAIGPGALVDARADGPLARALRQQAGALSARLGHG